MNPPTTHNLTLACPPRLQDHGLIAEVKVEIARGDADGTEYEEEIISESVVKEALESSLRNTNFSLGGTELFANRAVSVLAAQDFDECSEVDHNDCSDKAHCFNTLGSFLCACKDGYKDMDDMPGRQCAGTCDEDDGRTFSRKTFFFLS